MASDLHLEWNTPSNNTQSWHDNKPLLAILQYDLNNKLVKEWTSINEILETHKKYTKQSIMSCLNKSCEKRYNYIWKYKNPPIKKIRNKITNDKWKIVISNIKWHSLNEQIRFPKNIIGDK